MKRYFLYRLFRTIAKSKKVTLPGFDGMPVYNALRFFAKSIIDGDILNKAGSMAFSFFVALFPAIIFLFSLIPYIPIDSFQENLLFQIRRLLPGPAYDFAQQTIEELVNTSRFDLLSFGFIASIFFASNGVNAMIDNFNNSIHVLNKRSWLSQRLVSLYLILVLGGLIIISILLILFGSEFIHYLESISIIAPSAKYLLLATNWMVTLIFVYFSVSFFYYFGPNKKSRWKFFSAGSSIATIFIIIVSLIFGGYVNEFGTYNKIYGSIGAMMVVLLWIYFNCVVLVTGFELNASLLRAKGDQY